MAQSHFPSTQVYTSDCESVKDAAATYFPTRGIALADWPFKGKDWRRCREDYCFQLNIPQLRDPDGNVMIWPKVREKYFWPASASDEKSRWSHGNGFWETATKWKMGGSLELRKDDKGCFVRIDFEYGRGIRQYLVFLPFDEYGQSLLSNDHLEHESIQGIDKALPKR